MECSILVIFHANLPTKRECTFRDTKIHCSGISKNVMRVGKSRSGDLHEEWKVVQMLKRREVAKSEIWGESCFPSGQKSRPPGCYQHQPHERLEGYDIAVL